jgi:hypothetical protein
MTPTEVRNEIMKRYLNEFTGQFSIAFDNKKFDKPDGEKWVRLNIMFNSGSQDSLGKATNRKFIKQGLVFVQVFTPSNKGTNENDDLCNSSLNLLDGVRINDLWMYNGRINTIGSDGEFYQQNAVVEFEFENIR